ncbi:uncharacterized protein LOC128675387 [Plodia interpunctella]|uniref:uncharacterized protein LOC128675387 n=1 Tax=Plodia interpunctella TaxID=58824 RepID=UPI002368CC1A|nr:uncharacterized protein LOC128675387 [Plodia interpunctella]
MASPPAIAAKHPCADIQRPVSNVVATKEVAEAIGRDYRTLPTFEKGLFEYKGRKLYSLETNEFLKCHWKEYVRHFEDRVFAPFQFLDIRDYHFINCRNQLRPDVSTHTKAEFRFTLKPGPGVDVVHGTQLPIPQELLMTRGEAKSKRPKTGKARTSKENTEKLPEKK